MKVTVRMLKAKGACSNQVELFKSLFPNGVEVTEEVCVANADNFDWNWAANNLLTPLQLAKYQRIEAPARADFKRITASARAEYKRITASAFAKAALKGTNK